MNKKNMLLFILVCLVISAGFLFFPSQEKNDEAANIFSSSIYVNYHEQLRKFISQHPLYEKVTHESSSRFNSKLRTLIKTIENPLSPELLEKRVQHQKIVTLLRELSVMKKEDESSYALFEDLIQWLFLKVDLKKEMQDFLYQKVNPPKENLLSYLVDTQKVLRKIPTFDGVEEKGFTEDHFYFGNLPSAIGKFEQTILFRLGQPVYFRSYWSFPEISPEFRKFIQSQNSHLYVNLMKRDGIESPFTQALEALEKDFPSLSVITLDVNSNFYWQKEENYPNTIESSSFKKSFLEELLAKNGHYYWSQHLDIKDWSKELQTILTIIHTHQFGNQSVLTRQERQAFIDLCYLMILDQLVVKWKPNSMNMTCRQGMDRGPFLSTLWMLHKHLIADREGAALLLAPPLLIHNRPSHISRIERFVSTAKWL